MDRKMFCFQCEQTAGCSACTGSAGVCGKKSDTAELQDKLTGALIGLARATEGNESLVNEMTDRLVLEGLFTTITNVNFNNETISALIEKIEVEKERLVPKCFCCSSACGRNDNYDTEEQHKETILLCRTAEKPCATGIFDKKKRTKVAIPLVS